MIQDWLHADLTQLFDKNPDARVILWFDERNEFRRLLKDEIPFNYESDSYELFRVDGGGDSTYLDNVYVQPDIPDSLATYDFDNDGMSDAEEIHYEGAEGDYSLVPTGAIFLFR